MITPIGIPIQVRQYFERLQNDPSAIWLDKINELVEQSNRQDHALLELAAMVESGSWNKAQQIIHNILSIKKIN